MNQILRNLLLCSLAAASPNLIAHDAFAQDATDSNSPRVAAPRTTVIHRTTESMTIDGSPNEGAWKEAHALERFVFTWWREGDGPKQQTSAKLLWDDHFLYVLFECDDQDVRATRVERDSDVYRDDCVEVFASPELEHPENYFNLEINALGTRLDNYRPDGVKPEAAWDPDGIEIAISIDGTINDDSDQDRGWVAEVAIPFRLFRHCLPAGHPEVGDRWRLNLNRLDDEMAVLSQWSMGDPRQKSFHRPDRFGYVEFR